MNPVKWVISDYCSYVSSNLMNLAESGKSVKKATLHSIQTAYIPWHPGSWCLFLFRFLSFLVKSFIQLIWVCYWGPGRSLPPVNFTNLLFHVFPIIAFSSPISTCINFLIHHSQFDEIMKSLTLLVTYSRNPWYTQIFLHLSRCKKCSRITRFPRYNDPLKVLIHISPLSCGAVLHGLGWPTKALARVLGFVYRCLAFSLILKSFDQSASWNEKRSVWRVGKLFHTLLSSFWLWLSSG